MPQPKDLKNPVPRTAEPELRDEDQVPRQRIDFTGEASGEGMEIAASAPETTDAAPANEASATAAPAEAPGAASDPDAIAMQIAQLEESGDAGPSITDDPEIATEVAAASDPDMLATQIAELELEAEMLNADADIEDIEMAEKAEESPLSATEEFAARAKAGFGLGPKEQQQIIQKTLGPEFDVIVREDEIFFKKKGSKKYFPIDRDGFNFSLRETMGEFADLLGMGAETAAGVATLAGSTALGGPIGAAAGVAGEALVQTTLRRNMAEAFGAEVGESFASEYTTTLGLNAAMLGLGSIGKRLGHKFITSLKNTMESAPDPTVKQLAQIRQAYEEFGKQLGSKAYDSKSNTGQAIYDSVLKLREDMGDRMNVFNDAFKKRMGFEIIPVPTYRAKLEDVLVKEFDIPSDFVPMLADPKVRAQILAQVRKNKDLAQADGAGKYVTEIMDAIQEIDTDGGLNAKAITNLEAFWRERANFKNKEIKSVAGSERISEELRKAAKESRIEAMEKAFEASQKQLVPNAVRGAGGASVYDDSMAEAFRLVSREWNEKIDSIKQFRQGFANASKSGKEKFTNTFLKPNNSEAIRKFKMLLGADGPEFQAVKGHWIENFMEKSIDTKTGIVDPVKMKKLMGSYGSDTINEILSESEQAFLQRLIHRSNSVMKTGLNEAVSDQLAKDYGAGAIGMLTSGMQPTILARILWSLTKTDANFARTVANDGLLEVAVSLKDPVKKSALVKTSELLLRMINATDIIDPATGKQVMRRQAFKERIKDERFRDLISGIEKQIDLESVDPTAPSLRIPGGPSTVIGSGLKRAVAPESTEADVQE